MIIIIIYNKGGGLFTAFPKKMALHLLIKYITVYLTDFCKTNLTKFAVILTEKALKGRFLKPENSSKITVTKEKERRRRKKKKGNGCTLSFYNELLWT